MGIFNHNQKPSCKRRRCVWVWCGAVFFSLAVLLHADAHSSVVVTTAPHALPLIQRYVRTHARVMQTLQHAHHSAMRQLASLPRLSKHAIRHALEAQQEQRPQKTYVLNPYPIHTDALTPGDVHAKTITVTIPHPLFIVGDDARSRQWLNKNQARLASLHASGFVVKVASRDAMHALQHAFPALPLMALPGDALARGVPLQHYPVLIMANHLQQ